MWHRRRWQSVQQPVLVEQRDKHGESGSRRGRRAVPRGYLSLTLTLNTDPGLFQLYIDQPTQVGLSYSIPSPGYYSSQGDLILLPNNTCPSYASDCGTYSNPDPTLTANATDAAAPNFWKTLQVCQNKTLFQLNLGRKKYHFQGSVPKSLVQISK